MHTIDEAELVHEPVYDMFENESSVIVRMDLPGVEREQVHITASPPRILKVTGTRQAGSGSVCLHNERYTKFSGSIGVEKAVDFK
ncbi:hypothetical protein BJV82DRAFT_102239 [Fennellomyces sp. T-0311]|nr:hypothetical protein BJV82DRAFT_102239 [Fennellomyces sp. T-0311]